MKQLLRNIPTEQYLAGAAVNSPRMLKLVTFTSLMQAKWGPTLNGVRELSLQVYKVQVPVLLMVLVMLKGRVLRSLRVQEKWMSSQVLISDFAHGSVAYCIIISLFG